MEPFLFSIAVISYNNFQYIFETLDSIFKQDYPCLEILVSNDASEDFDMLRVIDYIEKNKKENIVSYNVWQQENNLGTVANAEFCRKNAHGKAFFLIAADDTLACSNAITCFAEAMCQNPREEIFCGNVNMCDESMEIIKHKWTTEKEVEFIKNNEFQKIFSTLSVRTIIPTTGTAYRTDFLEKMGGYDQKYKLIEDLPLYLRAMRLKIPVCWIDDVVISNHRAGGICHKEIDFKDKVFALFIKDRIDVFLKEIFPYMDLLTDNDTNEMLDFWYSCKLQYERTYANTIMGRMLLRAKYNTPKTIIFSLKFREVRNNNWKNIIAAYSKVVKFHIRKKFKR